MIEFMKNKIKERVDIMDESDMKFLEQIFIIIQKHLKKPEDFNSRFIIIL